MTPKTTRIRVFGEDWDVPRGFGRQYREAALEQHPATLKPGRMLARVRDMLLLVGYEATPAQIAEWPLRKRVEAEIYASNVMLRASDNILQRHPELPWLPKPWGGVDLNKGVFAGPGPTPIVETL